MRWSETGNYGTSDNPVMPNTFGAQVYDLGDPWANVGDGNRRKCDPQPCTPTSKILGLSCCGSDAPEAHPWGNCSGSGNGGQCSDKYNCSLPELGPDGQGEGVDEHGLRQLLGQGAPHAGRLARPTPTRLC